MIYFKATLPTYVMVNEILTQIKNNNYIFKHEMLNYYKDTHNWGLRNNLI